MAMAFLHKPQSPFGTERIVRHLNMLIDEVEVYCVKTYITCLHAFYDIHHTNLM